MKIVLKDFLMNIESTLTTLWHNFVGTINYNIIQEKILAY